MFQQCTRFQEQAGKCNFYPNPNQFHCICSLYWWVYLWNGSFFFNSQRDISQFSPHPILSCMLCNPTLKFVGPSIGLSIGLSVSPSITFSPSITLYYLMFLWLQFLYHTHPHCDKSSGAYRDRLCKSRYANFYGCVVNFKSGRHLPHFKILGAGGQNTSCIFLFGGRGI